MASKKEMTVNPMERSSNQDYKKLVADMRKVFDTGRTLDINFRLDQLNAMLRLVEENFDGFLAAMRKDMRKPKMEAGLYELEGLRNETSGAMRDLQKWVKEEKAPYNLLFCFDKAYVHKEPYGVVLIIGAWNYPVLLSLQPLIGAIAAGNCAIVKPSENAPHVAELIAELIPKYLDSSCYKVVEGNAGDTVAILEEQFDYIFATSSTKIGKSVMQAAAKHLTPITLELGGKSPVYLDDNSDIDIAARRIMWGKCINLAQTCIAPDYVLCSKRVEHAFISAAKKVIAEWYGNDPQRHPDLPRIINDNHFGRLCKLLDDTKGEIIVGGQTDAKDRWISPTLVVDVKESDVLMQDEIFGPILPFVTVNSKEEALAFIKARPKPLAMYIFSGDESVLDYFITRASSGAVCCNDTVVQNGWEGLPFGGVGDSGCGSYHGKYTYETFTHKKPVVVRNFNKVGEKMSSIRYPPYGEKKMSAMVAVMKHFRHFNIRSAAAANMVMFVMGVFTTFMVSLFWNRKQN